MAKRYFWSISDEDIFMRGLRRLLALLAISQTILITFRQNTDFCHSVNCVSKSFIFSIMAQETIIIVESHYYHSHYYVPRMPKRMPAEIAVLPPPQALVSHVPKDRFLSCLSTTS